MNDTSKIPTDHPDLIGPVAWRHQLPDGQNFLDGRNSRVVEGLQEALDHKDRFGGVLAPLFKLASLGDSDSWARELAPAVAAPAAAAADYDMYVDACRARGVLPCSRESFRSAVMAGGLDGQRHRETRMDTSSDRGGETGQRHAQAEADPHDHTIALARNAAFNEARGLLPALAQEHFNRTDVSEEFLNGLAYGACAYVAAIKKLQEQPPTAGLPESSRSAEKGQDEDLAAIREQASAWLKVYWTLNEVRPGFHTEGATGAVSAVLAIRGLAATAARKSPMHEGIDNG